MTKPNLLLIEDDSAVALTIDEHLRDVFHIHIVGNGEAAVDMALQLRPQAMILDLVLPDRTGFEVLDNMIRAGVAAPVVVITGVYRTSRHKRQAKERPLVVEFMEKPLSLASLRESVCRAAKIPETLMAATPSKVRVDRDNKAIPSKIQTEASVDDEEMSQVSHAFLPEVDKRLAAGTFNASAFTEKASHRTIGQTPFTVLLSLIRQRRTGALFCRRDNIKKIIYFRDGVPVSVRSNVLNECLGHILVREKIISEDDRLKSVEMIREETRLRQGQALVQLGVLTEPQVQAGLALQHRQKLMEFCCWREGEFRFDAGALVETGTSLAKDAYSRLLYEAIRRTLKEEECDAILSRMPTAEIAWHRAPLFSLEDLQLTKRERKFLKGLDTGKILMVHRDALLRESPMSSLHSKQLLVALLWLELFTAYAPEHNSVVLNPQEAQARVEQFWNAPVEATEWLPVPVVLPNEEEQGNSLDWNSEAAFVEDGPWIQHMVQWQDAHTPTQLLMVDSTDRSLWVRFQHEMMLRRLQSDAVRRDILHAFSAETLSCVDALHAARDKIIDDNYGMETILGFSTQAKEIEDPLLRPQITSWILCDQARWYWLNEDIDNAYRTIQKALDFSPAHKGYQAFALYLKTLSYSLDDNYHAYLRDEHIQHMELLLKEDSHHVDVCAWAIRLYKRLAKNQEAQVLWESIRYEWPFHNEVKLLSKTMEA